jgi:hypothetical protein
MLHRDALMRRRVRAMLALSLVLPAAACYDGNAHSPGEDDDEVDSAGEGEDDEVPELDGPEPCVDIDDFFREQVWAPILKQKCYACHNISGQAKDSDLVLQGTDYPGYLDANLQTLQNLAQLEIDGTSLILLKPTMKVEHGGGAQIDIDGAEYEALVEFVERAEAPVHCVDDGDIRAFYSNISLLDELETTRKALFLLNGRMPTEIEIAVVEAAGWEGLDEVLEQSTHEEAFYGRMREIYNDMMHTDAFLAGDDAVDTVDTQTFPNARWFDALPEDDIAAARNQTNDAIAREPLMIIDWIVRHDEPFINILTANYTLANPWSARSYGVSLDQFANPNDPNEWVPIQFPNGFPHAGLLTTSVFLNRYPTTDTNRNRARSRVVYDFFLATDVLRLAVRPIDITAIDDFNPTLYNANCSVCHDNVDPLAGAFQGFDDNGRYRPSTEGWYADMRPPGLGDTQIPFDQSHRALQWLAPEIVRDRRFAVAVVHTMFTGLTGQQPLDEPIDESAPDYIQRIRAYEAQDHTMGEIADEFIASNYEIRTVIKALVKTEWFRADGTDTPLSDERASELADMGSARVLSPELLHRRIAATTGIPWRKGGVNVLLSSDYYKFFYGGIDSASVTQRLTEMNGVMANIAERMSNEVACLVTAYDFGKPASDRLLMPLVERTDLPNVPASAAAIRANAVHLHEQLLGESLDYDDPEIDRTVALFEALWLDGKARMADTTEPLPTTIAAQCQAMVHPTTGEALPAEQQVTEDPDYTVRAWMGVITYLLGDYRFLYE